MSQSSTSRQNSFGGIVFRIYTIRGWMQRARKRLAIFRKTDIDELRGNEAIVRDDEHEDNDKSWMSFSIDETSTFYYLWTYLVCFVCLHPLMFIALSVFNDVHPFLRITGPFNFILDIINIIDLFIHTRLEYVENGVVVKKLTKILNKRLKSKMFLLDVLAVLPTESLEVFGESFFFTRLNRLLKVYRFSDFTAITETRTSFPHAFRLFKLIFLCIVIFHWNGCLYFHISKVYNYPSARLEHWIFSYDKIINPIIANCTTDNPFEKSYCNVDEYIITQIPETAMQDTVTRFMESWTNKTTTIKFTNFVRQYALSFYWSALTLVTLGEQPSPCTTFQNSFEIVDTLLGLVIFAVIVGDVGNMVVTINLRKSEFDNVLDGCKRFMIYRKVPGMLKKKAVEYFSYVWNHGGAQVDEDEIAEFLPPRLFGEIAVEIHMDTLKKVKLFEECDPRLLYELILKLQLRIYSPGDYICKKGEVGKEMYIVKEGFVEVVNDDGTKIFVTLGAGVVFGELSILNIPGNKNKNLRTASVRSKGFSDLYVLDKEDLWEALHEYPQAKDSLIEKGVQILKKDNLLDENMMDEYDEEFKGTLEGLLDKLVMDTQKLSRQMDEAEMTIRKAHQTWKHRVFTVETKLINQIKQQNRFKRSFNLK